jgi:undecaprenyl pyrophosphate phosphatase UppP
MQFKLWQVSTFYAFLIILLVVAGAILGYRKSIANNNNLQLAARYSAIGAVVGAMVGIFASYGLFYYVSTNNMIMFETYRRV